MGELRSIARRVVRPLRLAHQASGGGRCCYACKRTFRSFRPLRERKRFPLSASLRMIGGGGVVHCVCPFCESTDRDRHLLMYIDRLRLLDNMDRPRVLHFAPEPCLASRIADTNPSEYIKADFYPRSADVRKVDMTSIPFEGDRFDLVVANHVLEHVSDDKLALSELFRVMKPGGFGIFQVPIDMSIAKTQEDKAINTPELREKHYGQRDHFRLYGADYPERLGNAGFIVTTDSFVQTLPEHLAKRYALPNDEIIYLCVKPITQQ